MPAYLADSVLDSGLSDMASATQIHLCTAMPTSYGDVATYSKGATSSFSVSAPYDGAANGRRVTLSAITSGTCSGTGYTLYFAVVDHVAGELLAAETLSAAQYCSPGNTWTMANVDVLMPSADPPPAVEGLLYSGNLSVLGTFRVPVDMNYYEGQGGGAAFNSANNSLFTKIGNTFGKRILEISIPTLQSAGTISGLAAASLLQDDVAVQPLMQSWPITGDRLGDLHLYGGALIGTSFIYYDAAGEATASHYRINTPSNLAGTTGTGMFRVGTNNPGYTAGYMCDIPAAHQVEMGGPVLTGLSTVPIASRTSNGPSAWVWDPANISGTSQVAATPLCYYPLANPLGGNLNSDNDLCNWNTVITGVCWPEGTRSVLFFGRHGLGGVCYGTGTECNDPYSSAKGWHDIGGNYRHYIWAYDSDDLLDVKNGVINGWEVQPYSYWAIDLPFQGGVRDTGGVAYDAATNKIYWLATLRDFYDGREACPIVHVLEVTA